MISDSLLVDAVRWASQHKPCIIQVQTVLAATIVSRYLAAEGNAIATLSAETRRHSSDLIKGFDDGIFDYLICTRAMVLAGGWRTKRDAYVTATSEMNEIQRLQLAGRVYPCNEEKVHVLLRQQGPAECLPPT
jgi:hypothetical protein